MSEERAPTSVSRVGFWGGLAVGLLIIASAGALGTEGGVTAGAIRCIGVTVIVATWWVTEALPIGATALIPAATFPLLGITPAKSIAPVYANSFILLLLGGFLLAMALERSGAHRRLALYVLLGVGTSPRRLVFGFLAAAAALSMWISNTATALIMMPVAMAIVDRGLEAEGERAQNFGAAVMLCTAYGASLGGMGTPIGTPPNLIAIGALEHAYPNGPSVTFLEWMTFAVPVVIILVPILWVLVTRVLLRVPNDLQLGARDLIRDELRALGPWRAPEKRSLTIFAIAAILWVTREDVVLGPSLTIPGWATLAGLGAAPDDATVALIAALAAFMMPSGDADRSRLLPWSTAAKAPWDLVLLFGGGMALAKGFDDTGLSAWLGRALATFGQGSEVVFVAVCAFGAWVATEFISNTALANITMPVLAAAARQTDIDPRLIILPTALACSCAFMLPASTGPNAIVFGTGRVRIGQMARTGLLLNLVAWAVIVVWSLAMYGR
ncbi:MAG: SLC13/DASS family transporter [Deltaproteobacteria bacterium]|nr:SLC13/DASS family transporter [Deltaproteobacteria bacterium]